jgi:hypothetical protein
MIDNRRTMVWNGRSNEINKAGKMKFLGLRL